MQVNTGGELTGTLVGATVTGTSTISGTLTVEDGLTLNGTLTIADGDNGLYFVGSQALGGSGTIVLGDEASPYYTYYNYIYTDAAASTLTIDSGITISGDYGVLGGYYISYYGYNAYGGPIVNEGTIQADVSGGSVTVMGNGWQNTGTLEATNGATLNLLGTCLGTGEVQVDAGGELTGTLVGATVTGTFTISGTLTVEDGLTLNGTLTIADGDNGLYFVGSQALGGSGTIVLGDEASPYYTYYNYIYTDAAASTLTIDSGITISGNYGVLGGYYISYYGYTAVGGPIVNQGTIAADVGGGTITVMGNGWQNTGTLEATNGAILSLLGTCLGTCRGAGQYGGRIDRHVGRGDGNRHVDDQRHADGRGRPDAFDGTLTIADGDNGLYFVGGQALGGSGTIVFGNEASPYYTYYNYIYTDSATSTLTIDSGITISGNYGVLGGYYI